jgi:BirA family transcriptional regulator, biotin operon repressor / biotin---[acetyl-CoA-carboxylase] ligase
MQPREVVALLAAGAPVSGSALAQHFGVTRAAVWKRIEELRAAGLEIDAATGHGYRLSRPLELLDADAIRAACGDATARRLGELVVHWQLDSTSSELLRRSGPALPDLSVCLAEQQTAGRGRLGSRRPHAMSMCRCSVVSTSRWPRSRD